MPHAPSPRSHSETISDARKAVVQVIRGSDRTVELALAAFFAGGHVLLEGPPGTGKTTLAKTLAATFGGDFRRIQMTSDLLPSDIVGVVRLAPRTAEFEFRRGPLFANVVLADELNRTPPKTQSALLEAMAESTVTVDGQTYSLPDPFFVVATQNPRESQGVYALTESQLDRFMLKIEVARPGEAEELAIYSDGMASSQSHAAVLGPEQAQALRKQAASLHVDPAVLSYVAAVVRGTGAHPKVAAGASVRAGVQLLSCARALALVRGQEFVSPREIRELAGPALAHRLLFRDEDLPEAERLAAVAEVLAAVPAPV